MKLDAYYERMLGDITARQTAIRHDAGGDVQILIEIIHHLMKPEPPTNQVPPTVHENVAVALVTLVSVCKKYPDAPSTVKKAVEVAEYVLQGAGYPDKPAAEPTSDPPPPPPTVEDLRARIIAAGYAASKIFADIDDIAVSAGKAGLERALEVAGSKHDAFVKDLETFRSETAKARVQGSATIKNLIESLVSELKK